MARYRGQKSLYEVMNRARIKSSRSSTEPLHSETPDKAGTGTTNPTRQVEVARYRRPAPIQLNEGRIELTVPVKVAALLGLAVIVCLLLAFRLGQLYSATPAPATDNANLLIEKPTTNDTETEMLSVSGEDTAQTQTPEIETTIPSPPPQIPAGSDTLRLGNAIVIQEFDKLADLNAVGNYFNQSGIPTEIVSKGQAYFLITQERFSAKELGTKGYLRRQEIKELGKNYKAPQGLETFSTRYFSDAYSRLIDDTYIKE